jgi:excisionase family DNA binding protein
MTPADAELIAEAVIRLMEERKPYSGVLVSPEQLAEYLNVSRDYCYRHAAELGARKVGNKLRFSIPEVDERLRMAQPSHSETTSCSTSMGSMTGVPANGRVRRRRRRATAHTTATPAQTGDHDQA